MIIRICLPHTPFQNLCPYFIFIVHVLFIDMPTHKFISHYESLLGFKFSPKSFGSWLSPLQLGRVAPSGKEEGKRGFKVDGWGESWTKNNKFNCNPGLHFHKLGFSLTWVLEEVPNGKPVTYLECWELNVRDGGERLVWIHLRPQSSNFLG